MTVLIQIQSQVQMTVQMRSIKDAIAYGFKESELQRCSGTSTTRLIAVERMCFLFFFLYFDSLR